MIVRKILPCAMAQRCHDQIRELCSPLVILIWVCCKRHEIRYLLLATVVEVRAGSVHSPKIIYNRE